jgi:hypothetical protein
MSALIIHRPAVRLVRPPYLPLVAPVPWGRLALEWSVLEGWEASGGWGQPWLGDGTGSFLRDSVMHGASISVPGSAAWVARRQLPGSPLPPID